ncbi:MAG: xanthine dehydrogenase family protein molybdopterin-binding subunit, partial [Chloroflexota bacterium]
MAVLRREDARLLKGGGQYVSDLQAPGLLVAAILRSPHAHARIRSVDLSATRGCPGVVLTMAGQDLAELPAMPDASANTTERWLERVKPRLRFPRQRILALDEVPYVGYPVAVAVARDHYVAEDALDAIRVEYEPLPASVDLLGALEPEAPRAQSDAADNVLFEFRLAKGD